MNNIMAIDGYRAVIQYDPEVEMFRGEFVGLNGGADFYADSVSDLRKEGRVSSAFFLKSASASVFSHPSPIRASSRFDCLLKFTSMQ